MVQHETQEFVETCLSSRTDFVFVRYLVINNGLPSNSEFIFQMYCNQAVREICVVSVLPAWYLKVKQDIKDITNTSLDTGNELCPSAQGEGKGADLLLVKYNTKDTTILEKEK
jgi:hypothetical protein